MKSSRLAKIITFCGALCVLPSCSTTEEQVVIEEEPIEYKLDLNKENSSFKLEMMQGDFSMGFNNFILGDQNSVGFFQFSNVNSDKDFIQLWIDFYKGNSDDSILYSMQVQIVKPDFEIRINRRFINNEDGEKIPSDFWQVYGSISGRLIGLTDTDGDGNLESIIYEGQDTGLSRDIIEYGNALYNKCRKYVENLGGLENLRF